LFEHASNIVDHRCHVRFVLTGGIKACMPGGASRSPVRAMAYARVRTAYRAWSQPPLAHWSREVARAFNEALNNRAQGSIFQRDDVDRPWVDRQIDRQHFERLEVRHRPRHCGDELAIG